MAARAPSGARGGRIPLRLPSVVAGTNRRMSDGEVAAERLRGIDQGMGSPESPNTGPAPVLEALPDVERTQPDASVAPPPLLDGIVRVKVPADRIVPFLAKTALFKNAPKEVISRVAPLLQGLACADGSELVTH